MAHVRGVHETGGLRALRVVGAKATRGKLTAKLARLDHQRALLERQLAVWTEKQQVTRHRLGLLDKEIAQISRVVRNFVRPRSLLNGRKRAHAAEPEAQANGAGAVRGNDLSLEY